MDCSHPVKIPDGNIEKKAEVKGRGGLNKRRCQKLGEGAESEEAGKNRAGVGVETSGGPQDRGVDSQSFTRNSGQKERQKKNRKNN